MRKIRLSVNIKSWYLLLAVVGLLALLSPAHVLAQTGKDGLVLRYAAGSYNSEVAPGETRIFYIEVANESSSATTNIQLTTSDAPKGWVVAYNPQNIDTLNASSFQTVDVSITAPQNVQKGGYAVTVIADSSIGRRAMSISVWVAKGTNLWMWLGGALGVVVIAVFVIIFKRFNKD